MPTLTLLDSFKRAPENPLSNGGKWTAFPSCDGVASGVGKAPKIEEEALHSSSGFPTGETSAYWNLTEFTDLAGAFKTHKKSAVLEKERIRLFFRLSKQATTAFSGYFLELEKDTETENKWVLRLKKFKESGASTTLREVTFTEGVEDGDLWGVTAEGNEFQMYHKAGAGAWTAVGSAVTDATYTKGWCGMGIRATEGRPGAQNFEVASVVSHNHTLTATQTSSASVARAPERKLTAEQTQTASAATKPSRVLSASQSQSATIEEKHGHATSHTLTATQTSVATMTEKLAGKRLTAEQPSEASATVKVTRVLSTTQTSTIEVTEHGETPPVSHRYSMLL